jgi:hypothetical protein
VIGEPGHTQTHTPPGLSRGEGNCGLVWVFASQ